MGIIHAIIRYFQDDPARILTFLGGSGVIVIWIQLYRNRARVRVRILQEEIVGLSMRPTLHFEAENIGSAPTSMTPDIILIGFSPHRAKRRFIFHIESEDRGLPPSIPRTFAARTEEGVWTPPLWFKVYTFRPTKGRVRRIRIRNSDYAILSFPQFYIERFLFLLFGKVRPERKQ